MATAALLECEHLSVSFGGVHAVRDVDFSVDRSEIVGLIGPNGAGKTTLVNALSGAIKATTGEVRALGRRVSRLDLVKRSRLGIVRTFQTARLFADLTSGENVEVALLQRGVRPSHAAGEAAELLGWIGFRHEPGTLAGSLPYGEQRRVAIARALAMKPVVLMLDEPAARMTEAETRELSLLIKRIRDERECAIVVVEHDMSLIMSVSDVVHVLVDGATLIKDTPSVVRSDPRVITAYLGTQQ